MYIHIYTAHIYIPYALNRDNDEPQEFGRSSSLVLRSGFNPKLPTKVAIDGWFGAGWFWFDDMRRELLKQVNYFIVYTLKLFSSVIFLEQATRCCCCIQESCNFIQADWGAGSWNINYMAAKQSAQQAGTEIAGFLNWLHQEFGLKYQDVHVIGHSLGAQAAGALGKYIQSPKIARISGTIWLTNPSLVSTNSRLSFAVGLDPAQPGFNLSNPDDVLGPEDADFVGKRCRSSGIQATAMIINSVLSFFRHSAHDIRG